MKSLKSELIKHSAPQHRTLSSAKPSGSGGRPQKKTVLQPKIERTAPPVYRPQLLSTALQSIAAPPLQSPDRVVYPQRVVPPVYKPQAEQNFVQAKMAGLSQLKGHPTAPPVYKPHPVPRVLQAAQTVSQQSLKVQSGIQLSKKGKSGGKEGFNYTSGGLHYDKEKVEKAQQQTGVKPKGHSKGKPGSGESTQTKNDNKKLFTQLRANDAKEKSDTKLCREFHAKKKNAGKTCPVCRERVD